MPDTQFTNIHTISYKHKHTERDPYKNEYIHTHATNSVHETTDTHVNGKTCLGHWFSFSVCRYWLKWYIMHNLCDDRRFVLLRSRKWFFHSRPIVCACMCACVCVLFWLLTMHTEWKQKSKAKERHTNKIKEWEYFYRKKITLFSLYSVCLVIPNELKRIKRKGQNLIEIKKWRTKRELNRTQQIVHQTRWMSPEYTDNAWVVVVRNRRRHCCCRRCCCCCLFVALAQIHKLQ